MSRVEEATVCSSPDPIAFVSTTMSVPSSSRASSSSSFRVTANGSTDRLVDVAPPFSSSSQSSLRRCSSDAMPQAEGSADGSGASTPDVDTQILEALKSKDRLFVLKMGEQMEGLIRERNSRSKINLTPENQYQRLLVHRCAQYYRLTPETDPVPRDKSGIRDMSVSITVESRIPVRRISELVPAEQTQLPAFKIMRRTELDRRRQKSSASRPGSIAGEDGELSDPGPSETGSMGSRSTTSKKHMTIAEREAAYEKARTRIFKDFEEKEKAKERDTSASSSTFSLASASGSGSHSGGAGCSSVSDIDDNASTAPTESEWSVPVTDRRRGGELGMNSAESTRSFPSFNPQGSESRRDSGTTSPSFTYPSLYDPSGGQPQAQEQPGYMAPTGPYMAAPMGMYFPPQPPQNPGPVPAVGPPYIAQYQYYPQFPYGGLPPQQPHPNSDPASPVSGPSDAYPHHSMSAPHVGPSAYGWIPHPAYQHQQPPSEHHSAPGTGPNHVHHPPIPGVSPMAYPYPAYMPPPGPVPYAGYAAYFPPPQSQPPQPPIVHPHSQPLYPIDLPPTNGSGSERGTSSGVSSGKGSPSPTLSRHTNSSGSSNGHHNHINGNHGIRRGAPPARGAWSYGPGLGMHSSASSPGPGVHSSPGGGEIVGPRLSQAMRRTSASSSSGGHRTPADETASVASSSTSSSSSRRTYLSTPPKHPLPPRPDWAAGLKAQPTLHPTTRHRRDSNNSRTMSPARPPGQPLPSHHQPPPQQRPPIHLQPNDFPPLSSIASPSHDKRPPAGGVWSNVNSTARTVLSPNPGHSNHPQGITYGTALFNHTGANRLEDDERGFERPPRKGSAELFNPKGGAKKNPQSQQKPSSQVAGQEGAVEQVETIERDGARGERVANAILVDKMGALKIQTHGGEGEIENTPRAESVLSGLFRDLGGESVGVDGGAISNR
ncbi:uncharacterized protein FOMMEDRAFT_143762, partial [Fomitiporia mediterranea MF3/22]|uniref:uncharacterized protein n=1 Tax=Fomitiporia mediterranea (strain MF3/22) TaxID=694068 RepID=UPI0004408BC0